MTKDYKNVRQFFVQNEHHKLLKQPKLSANLLILITNFHALFEHQRIKLGKEVQILLELKNKKINLLKLKMILKLLEPILGILKIKFFDWRKFNLRIYIVLYSEFR